MQIVVYCNFTPVSGDQQSEQEWSRCRSFAFFFLDPESRFCHKPEQESKFIVSFH